MNKSFDVFLSHNSKDKPAVGALAEALRGRGLRVWLDEWELIPGRRWQEALEEIIETTGSSAVLVGKDGLGPWQDTEMRGCLQEFVSRKIPVIPVILPGAPEVPKLPLFLKQFTWVDLRGGLTPEGIDKLQWGVTGEKANRLHLPPVEARGQSLFGGGEHLSVYIDGQPLPETGPGRKPPTIVFRRVQQIRLLSLEIRNDSDQAFLGSSHVYFMTEDAPLAVPCSMRVTGKIKWYGHDDEGQPFEEEREDKECQPLRPFSVPENEVANNLRLLFKLPVTMSAIPPHAVDQLEITLKRHRDDGRRVGASLCRLRIHTALKKHEFDFYLERMRE